MLYLFDFDGTIVDSAPGVLGCAQHAMRQMGYPVPTLEELRPFMGPPLNYSFRTLLHMSEEEAERAVSIFRERYTGGGMYECAVYEGIPELLRDVRAAGHVAAIASAKPEPYVRSILDHVGLLPRFDVVVGASMQEKTTDKANNIRRVICEAGYAEKPEEVWMIGDRCYDIEGAISCGVYPVGVLYGYGDREELEASGAKRIAATVGELRELLLSA